MTTFQLPEGYTVRKVGNSLKVVPMRKKVAIVEQKAMLKAVRKNYSNGEFDCQMSLKATVWASKGAFTVDELVAALQSVSQGEAESPNRRKVERVLAGYEGQYDAVVQIDADTYEYRAS